ncbi:MAG: HlyD family efflux transporter periplasmic adaptor subunit [Kofleriaceae bacterium]|nr:HlyD family efflux transporter periplasmic adaptor subunit [Kofleriaceae bacterium]
MRRSSKSWGQGGEAPTFLPPDETTNRPVRPVRKVKSDSVITSAPKAPASRAASQSTIRPQQAPVQGPQQAGARASQPAVRASSPAVPEQLPPYMQFEGGATFDPNALPLPPELAPPVYSWLRRLALQADLPGADRLLREALAELTSALSILIIYNGPEGLYTLAANDELPKDQSPIVAVAKSRRALVSSHVAYVPLATANETIAVVQLTRNSRQEPFNMIDSVTMAAMTRESASIMHHLVVEHLQRRTESEADKKSLYRPEALESHRRRGQEGSLTELSPGWVRNTYRVLIAALVVGIFFAVTVKVPTYSTGTGVVVFDGTSVSAPQPGTVDHVYAQSGQEVHKGTILLTLKSDKEESDLKQATTELEHALHQYMHDRTDESVRKSLISAQAAQKRAADALAQRTVRAPVDGTVFDVNIHDGSPLEFGAPILTISAPGTEPEVWAYLPGSDRPRLREGQKLQVELTGYQKGREEATIYEVARSSTGSTEARRTIGPVLADTLKLDPNGGTYVLVKAKLPKRQFTVKGRSYNYHPGMPAKTEVRVENKRFIVTLIPALEKYL